MCGINPYGTCPGWDNPPFVPSEGHSIICFIEKIEIEESISKRVSREKDARIRLLAKELGIEVEL